jgi:HSP20 family molecular chaperone IbpA
MERQNEERTLNEEQDELETEAGDQTAEEVSETGSCTPVRDLGASLTSSMGDYERESNECDALRGQLFTALQALDEMEALVEAAQIRSRECETLAAEVPALRERIAELERANSCKVTWPVVRESEIGDDVKQIRVECPGADEDAIDISGLPNGVRLRINGVAGSFPNFERDFVYDHQKYGHFELRMDECTLENGVLLLPLKRVTPQRMKLRRAPNDSKRLALVPIAEASQELQTRGDRVNDPARHGVGCRDSVDQKPERFVISPARTGSTMSSKSNGSAFNWAHAIAEHRPASQKHPELFVLTPARTVASCDDDAASEAPSEVTSQQWLHPQTDR